MTTARSTEYLFHHAKSYIQANHLNRRLAVIISEKTKSIDRLDPKTGWSQLHEAVVYRQTKKVQDLIKQGASVNLSSKEGQCALHYAVEQAHGKIIQLLLSNGADPSKQASNGKSALHIACEKDDLSLVKSIMENNASAVNVKDQLGRTPLHYAAQRENYELFRYLCDRYGADMNAIDQEGKKPYQLAHGKMFYDFTRSNLSSPRLSILQSARSQSIINENKCIERKDSCIVSRNTRPREPREISQIVRNVASKLDHRAPLKSRPQQFENVSVSFQQQVHDISKILSKRADISADEGIKVCEKKQNKSTMISDTTNRKRPYPINDENADPNVMTKTPRTPKTESFIIQKKKEEPCIEQKPKTKIALNVAVAKSSQHRQNIFSFGFPANRSSPRDLEFNRSDNNITRLDHIKPHAVPSPVSQKQKPILGVSNNATDLNSSVMYTFQDKNMVKPARDSILGFLDKYQQPSQHDSSTNYSSSARPSTIWYDSNPQSQQLNIKQSDSQSTLFSNPRGTKSFTYSSTSTNIEDPADIEVKSTNDYPERPLLVNFYESWKAANRPEPQESIIPRNRVPIDLQRRREPVFEGLGSYDKLGCCSNKLMKLGTNIQEALISRRETLDTKPINESRPIHHKSMIIMAQPLDLAFVKIESWLTGIGLKCLIPNFKDNNYAFLKEFRDDFLDRPHTDFVNQLGIDKVGHQAWLLFKLKEDFGEIERKGVFKHAHENPTYNFEYPSIENWLKSNGWGALTSSFVHAGYYTIEQLLMQLELQSMRLDEQFLKTQLDIYDKDLRVEILRQITQVYEIGAAMSFVEIKQNTFLDVFKRVVDTKVFGFLKRLII